MKLLIGLSFMLLGISLLMLGALKAYKIYLAGEIAKYNIRMTDQQIVFECQKLYATSTKSDFKYADCLKELRGKGEVKGIELL